MIPHCDILIGDVRARLRELPAESLQCVVTSPPYWGLRDYGVEGQIGLEPTVDEWVATLVDVFSEVRRVLKADGTCWINLGDSYVGSGLYGGKRPAVAGTLSFRGAVGSGRVTCTGLKSKDLVGQPWRLAFALQTDGWFLRQDIIWHKPNPMPESVSDRCTKAHEYIFLFTKSAQYYFDAQAIEEPTNGNAHARGHGVNPKALGANSRIHRDRDPAHQSPAKVRAKQNRSFSAAVHSLVERRNKRSVWTIATEAYSQAHYATFPRDLVRPCILAGSRIGDTVLDPFGGSGTTASVSLEYGRNAILIDLNPANETLMRDRIAAHVGQGVFNLISSP